MSTDEVECWKAAAEANDRSYRIAYEALEMTRAALAEMTKFRDNAMKRLEWAQKDVERLQADLRHVRADLAREKKARREAARAKKSPPKRGTDR